MRALDHAHLCRTSTSSSPLSKGMLPVRVAVEDREAFVRHAWQLRATTCVPDHEAFIYTAHVHAAAASGIHSRMQSLRTLLLARDTLLSEVRNYTQNYSNTMAPPNVQKTEKSQAVPAKPIAEKAAAGSAPAEKPAETPAALSSLLAAVANKEEEAAAKKQGMFSTSRSHPFPIRYESSANV